ncbi:MAG: hypothetical protein H6733_06420 [Alphaproteobacteria bacterium]|nr:hypothetical protein [Alphaproteobacteria bacterium]
MSSHTVLGLALTSLLSWGAPALAAPDLVTSVQGPYGLHVYETGTYTVTVANAGRHTAQGVSVVIHLPQTATSPTVHLLGQLASVPGGCSLQGTDLVCSLGRLGKNRSASVQVDLMLPEASTAPQLVADASTTTYEPDLSDNVAVFTPTLLAYPVVLGGTRDATNDHCTGTGLTSYWECLLFPSSITSHDSTFEASGAISIPGAPGFGGSWSQPTADTLVFTYTDPYSAPVLSFTGRGVGGDCWEGLVVFSTGSWVSQYRVCLD